MRYFLVLIETAGNQDYIFSTNKLRENVGASQLTYESGTRWVLEAVAKNAGPDLLVLHGGDVDTEGTRSKILEPGSNIPVRVGGVVEVVYATSGKALLLVRANETMAAKSRARAIVSAVTARALADAPGLDLCGAIHEVNWQTDRIDKAIVAVHNALDRARERRSGPRARFARLPIVDQCASSGLPAAGCAPEVVGGLDRPISAASLKKRGAAFDRWKVRVDSVLRRHEATRERRLAPNPNALERKFDGLEWTGVVHCDANGLGALFLTLHEQVWGAKPAPTDWGALNASYIESLRRLSIDIEASTEAAFAAAVATLPELLESNGEKWTAVVPILLGGDDFTVLCDGRHALRFTQAYLDNFEAETARDNIAVFRIDKGDRLASCGGVAITKPHFPFHLAYDLAEQLTASAKIVKKEVAGTACSALDFHILFDSTFVDLGSIRDRLVVDGGTTSLTRKPYITTATQALTGHTTSWTTSHSFLDLTARIEQLTKGLQHDGDDGGIPNSQLHDIRGALFQGRGFAQAHLGLVRHRYPSFVALEAAVGGLFGDVLSDAPPAGQETANPSPPPHITHDTQLLDLMEAQQFWGEAK